MKLFFALQVFCILSFRCFQELSLFLATSSLTDRERCWRPFCDPRILFAHQTGEEFPRLLRQKVGVGIGRTTEELLFDIKTWIITDRSYTGLG